MTKCDVKDIPVDRKNRFVVGKKLGEGAQGTVYNLINTRENRKSPWCIKITPHAKPTRSRQSEAEMNQRLLAHERTLYHSRLIGFRGSLIPNVPRDEGDTRYLETYKQGESGWNFLVLEQMKQSLLDGVLALCGPSNNQAVDLTPIAVRLVDIFEAFHEERLVVTDVKLENFMLADGAGPLEERLRMIDLALVKEYVDERGRHAANEGVSSLRGTPLYASINAHTLQSPSRRDDMESLLYLVCDLVIAVNAKLNGNTERYFHNGSYLPWNRANSDQEILEQKQSQTVDLNSELFQRMPRGIASAIMVCFDYFGKFGFNKTPPYKDLKEQFEMFTVSPLNRKRKGRLSRSSPVPSRRVTRASAGAQVIEVGQFDDEEEEDSAVEPMDIDGGSISDDQENRGAIESELKPDRKYKAGILTVVEGPHKGEQWVLQEGEMEAYCIGTNPSRKGHLPIALPNDSQLDNTHARVKLELHKRKLLVLLWDNKSKGGTKRNGKSVKGVSESSHTGLFAGDKIQIGDTVIQLSRAPESNR